MEKEFSEEFWHDLADVIEFCEKNGTNRCDFEFEIDGMVLTVDFAFSLKEGSK